MRARWELPSSSLPWNVTNHTANYCEWGGVTCSGGTVTHLDLKNVGLSGTLPPSLANLTQMYDVQLAGNALTGSIPAEYSEWKMIHSFNISYIRNVWTITIVNARVWVCACVNFSAISHNDGSAISNSRQSGEISGFCDVQELIVPLTYSIPYFSGTTTFKIHFDYESYQIHCPVASYQNTLKGDQLNKVLHGPPCYTNVKPSRDAFNLK